MLITEGGLIVGGYQGYEILNRVLTFKKAVTAIKYEMIRPYFQRYLQSDVIADIGCSAGAIGIKMLEEGAKRVVFIDHDPSYTKLVRLATEKAGLGNRSEIYTTKVGQFDQSVDTGIALALIHWMYSYSEAFGSLDQIVRELRKIASKTLIVEWVSPSDAAIRTAKHIDKNPEVHRAPYTLQNFVAALKKNYRFYETIGQVSSTRNIWIASQEKIQCPFNERLKAKLRIGRIKQIEAMDKLGKRINSVLPKA